MNFFTPSIALALSLCMAATAAAQVTVDFPVIQDSYANENQPTRNFGSLSTMTIRKDDVKIPYLQFQTYGITGTVTSATLYCRVTGDTGSIRAHAVPSQTWDESVLTFTNKPAWNSTQSGSVTFTTTGWKSIPVTPAVTGNGMFSFALLTPDLVNAEVYSLESAYIPYLRVTYQPVNQNPVAQPETYSVFFNTIRSVAAPGVLANDSDPNGDPLTAQLVTSAANGTLNLAADGSFTYQPNTGFSGTDTFSYRALDISTGQSSPTTVSLTVLAQGVGQLTPAELSRIQTDLGITLTLDQQIELASLVKPVAIDPWRAAADARIDLHRKADLGITVVSSQGTPIQGAAVRARLKRKGFRFGGVLDLNEFASGISGGMGAADYRALVPKYFDAVGLNNGLKPKLSATNPTALNNLANVFFPWCSGNNMPVRGHLLLWPGGDHMSAAVEAKVVEIENTASPTQTQLDELRSLVDNEITAWATQWNVYEWDVVNEVLGNHRIQDILGPNEIVRWFQLAQSAAAAAGRPNTGRLINEYQIISGNGEGRIPPYKSQIQYLIDNNAPITGIGFQSRFKFRREDPALLYSRLEQFSGYNRDLVGTEFEVISNPDGSFNPDENLRAQMTEEIMTTYFSHPKVTGFFAWEFANSETRALVTNSGVPKLNALVWYYLNRIRYHTDLALTTDPLGRVSLRGFRGDYEITVNAGTTPVVQNYTLSADSQIQIGTAFSANSTHTLDVIEDTFAQEANPANTGNFSTIQLRTPNGSLGRVGYLKFTLPVLTGNVLSAKLVLHSIDEPHPVQALAVNSNTWTETSLTWNNRPATGAVLGTGTAAAIPGTVEIPLVSNAIPATGGAFSVALNETAASYGSLASSENTTAGIQKPQLVIVTGIPDSDGDGISDILDPDDDNDGIPDAHEVVLGLDPLLGADATSDPDGDGYSTLVEYALGGDPASPNILADYLAASPTDAGTMRLTLRRRTGLTGGPSVRVGTSGTLGDWEYHFPEGLSAAGYTIVNTTTSTANDSIGPVETLTLTLSSAAARGFFRLQVQYPPP